LVAKRHPLVLKQDFGHRYVQVMRWASDSRAFLVVAFGHRDSERQPRVLDPWLCVFALDELRVSLDLGLLNRGALNSRSEGEATPRGPWR
jgi:hypothetical protein